MPDTPDTPNFEQATEFFTDRGYSFNVGGRIDAGFALKITDDGSAIVPAVTEGQEWPQPINQSG